MIIRNSMTFTFPASGTYEVNSPQDFAIKSGSVFQINSGFCALDIPTNGLNLRRGSLTFRNKAAVPDSFSAKEHTFAISNPGNVAACILGKESGNIAAASSYTVRNRAELDLLYDEAILVEDFMVTLAMHVGGTVSGSLAWVLDVSEVKRDVKRLNVIQQSLL